MDEKTRYVKDILTRYEHVPVAEDALIINGIETQARAHFAKGNASYGIVMTGKDVDVERLMLRTIFTLGPRGLDVVLDSEIESRHGEIYLVITQLHLSEAA